MTGRLATPADADWDQVRSAWNLAVDQRPDAVALVADVADVQAVITVATQTGRRVVPQGTGHNASPLGDLSGTILVRTDRLRDVVIDPARRSARIGAGVVWGEVVAAAAQHGLTALAGSSADVGVVGYTLGGGFSWFARSRGVAANHVTAIELVTGDGVFRRISATCDPELFWAVRGGGGNFGVVTAMEFDLFERQMVYAGALFFPIERAREIPGRLPRVVGRTVRGGHHQRAAAARSADARTAGAVAGQGVRRRQRGRSTCRPTRPLRCSRRCVTVVRSSTCSPRCRPRRWPWCTWTRRSRFPVPVTD